MVINKTKAVGDKVVDAKTGTALASTYGNNQRASQISKIINEHVEPKKSISNLTGNFFKNSKE